MEKTLDRTSHCESECIVIPCPCCGWDNVDRIILETAQKAKTAGVATVVFFGSSCCGNDWDFEKIANGVSRQGIKCLWVNHHGRHFPLPVRMASLNQLPQLIEFAETYNAGADFLNMMDRLRKENRKLLFQQLEEAWIAVLRKNGITTLHSPFGLSKFVAVFPDRDK